MRKPQQQRHPQYAFPDHCHRNEHGPVTQFARLPIRDTRGCQGGGNDSFSITPTFRVTPVTIAAQPTNASNGKATGLLGQISSVNEAETASSWTARMAPTQWASLQAIPTAHGFQGVDSIGQLASGMPVDMDVGIQADGTLLATRVP